MEGRDFLKEHIIMDIWNKDVEMALYWLEWRIWDSKEARNLQGILSLTSL